MENLTKKLYYNFEESSLKNDDVALLCIDMQYYDCETGYGFFKDIKRDDPKFSYYFNQLESTVFPTVKKIQDLFRKENQEVIHVKIESLTEDGRDRSSSHITIDCHGTKDKKEAEFIEQVAPLRKKIVS